MSDIGGQGWAIGELAEASGVSVRALRHYDDIGLLRPTHRTPAGHRRYDRAAAGRLYRIVALRQLGFGLAEVGAVLDQGGDDPAALLAAAAAQHLEALDARIAAATALRPRLAALAGTGPGAPDPTDLTLEVTDMTVRLDRITTRTGDTGLTSLARGPRVPKDHARVEALGAVDELNAQVGVALAQPDVVDGHRPILGRVQQRLFDLGADLARPGNEGGERPVPSVGDDEVAWVEAVVAEVAGSLPPLDSFVLPGGGPHAAHLHACRTACRTAERRVVALGPDQHPEGLRYLNRLSDLCFVLARAASRGAEVTWQPAGS